MMRNSISRVGIFCTLSIITICAGCSSIYNSLTIDREGHVDLSGSGSAGVATIRGTTFDIGVASTDCWMKYPANAKRVTLDAGMGDIIATCTSAQSRNRHVGIELGKGRKIDEIIEEMVMVAEGVKSAPTVMAFAAEHDVEMPIAAAGSQSWKT